MDIFVCVNCGLSYKEAQEMDPSERRAWFMAAAMQEGYKIDWEDNGRIYWPEESD